MKGCGGTVCSYGCFANSKLIVIKSVLYEEFSICS